MDKKISITDYEWQCIFNKIWNEIDVMKDGDWGFIELLEHKYYYPQYFLDTFQDNVLSESDNSDEMDDDDKYVTTQRLFSTILIRDDFTSWNFYIAESSHLSCGIDYFCGKNYINLTKKKNNSTIKDLKNFLSNLI